MIFGGRCDLLNSMLLTPSLIFEFGKVRTTAIGDLISLFGDRIINPYFIGNRFLR
jgi:hypothetical protein